MSLEKSKRLVTSITILSIKFLVRSANFIPFHRVAIITNSPKAAASATVPTAIRFQVIAEQTFIGLIHRSWNDRLNIMFLTHDIRPRPHPTWLQFHYLTEKISDL